MDERTELCEQIHDEIDEHALDVVQHGILDNEDLIDFALRHLLFDLRYGLALPEDVFTQR